jgi:hypothetical protein
MPGREMLRELCCGIKLRRRQLRRSHSGQNNDAILVISARTFLIALIFKGSSKPDQ